MRAVSAAILCGGQSRRMGQDKGLRPFLGRPLIRRMVERVQAATHDVVLVINRPGDYAFMGLPMRGDETPGLGPLGGMLTALTHCEAPLLALVACDMPFVNSTLLSYAAGLLEDNALDAVVPLSGDGYEPLHAVYRVTACLPAVRAAIARHDLSLHGLLLRLNICAFPLEACAPFDPHRLAFTNANTPDEWRAAEETARRSGA
jgi:molybdopterin-guanine dinucleotide biosynthesis protein A